LIHFYKRGKAFHLKRILAIASFSKVNILQGSQQVSSKTCLALVNN